MLERLQKIISRAGISSRRHAEQLIQSGQVRVNGQVVKELGTKADAGRDRIVVAGRVVEIAEQRHYFLLNKPPRVVTTLADPEGRQSLRELLRRLPERVYPVGRLDYASSGLVLLTNDGELANRILKLAGKLPQTYWVKVKGRLSTEEQARVAAKLFGKVHAIPGVQGKRAAPNPWYEVKFSSVSRDVLRHMLFQTGHPVEKLRRVGLANLELGDLPEGQTRSVMPVELRKLEQNLARLEGAAPGRGKQDIAETHSEKQR